MTAAPILHSPADRYTVELLAELAAASPELPGAACVEPEARAAFDLAVTRQPGSTSARRRALTICGACPALTECRRWLDSLDEASKPFGVTAAQVIPVRADRATVVHLKRRRAS